MRAGSQLPPPPLSLITPTVAQGAGPGEVGLGEGNLGRRLLHGVGRDCWGGADAGGLNTSGKRRETRGGGGDREPFE